MVAGANFMSWARSHRGVVLTLAMLALALKVLIPPGYMASAATNSLPFAIVICTGQGAIVVDPGESHEDRRTTKQDAPCVFAGHGLGAAPPSHGDQPPRPSVAYYPAPLAPSCAATPGRGLCAPPLPARGPPLSI